MNPQPPDEDQNNRIVAVTLDEESIGRSGPDIEHERAIAIYDLIEENLFAPDGHDGSDEQDLHASSLRDRLLAVQDQFEGLSIPQRYRGLDRLPPRGAGPAGDRRGPLAR